MDVCLARPLLVYKVSGMNLKTIPLLGGCRMAWQVKGWLDLSSHTPTWPVASLRLTTCSNTHGRSSGEIIYTFYFSYLLSTFLYFCISFFLIQGVGCLCVRERKPKELLK